MNDMDMIFLYKDYLETIDLSFLEGHCSYDKESETLTIKLGEEEEMKPNE